MTTKGAGARLRRSPRRCSLLVAAAHRNAGGGHAARLLVHVLALLRLPGQLGVLGVVMHLQVQQRAAGGE